MSNATKSSDRKAVAVLISGRGSNMTALIKAAFEADFPARIALVISNKASAGGLRVAEEFGIPTRVIKGRDYETKEAYDEAIDACLRENGIEYVCLAGFMRLLTGRFVKAWQNRMINVHPSLLPSFKGLDTHERALSAGVKLHGCTVHFVTEEMDDGPIIIQAAVPVLDSDTPDTLSQRVLAREHAIYPQALKWLAAGQLRVSGGRVLLKADVVGDKGLIAPTPLPDKA